ncbi:MAG: M15 family metallopeptidase [Saprospiraceae bacterium]
MKYFFLFSFLLFFSACEEKTKNNSNNHTPDKTLTDTIHEVISEKEIPKPIVFDYDTTQWTDLHHLDSTIIIDMRYATTNNFVKEKMYDCSRCFLRPQVAKKIVEAHLMLQEGGLSLKMLDCFRPRPIQQKLWNKFKNPLYVTNPAKGSMHNRGAAVDLTIVDADGKQLDMGTAFDYFGKEAHHAYTKLSKEVLANRKLLLETMQAVELHPITTEWWHYSFRGKRYELSDMLWECDLKKNDSYFYK